MQIKRIKREMGIFTFVGILLWVQFYDANMRVSAFVFENTTVGCRIIVIAIAWPPPMGQKPSLKRPERTVLVICCGEAVKIRILHEIAEQNVHNSDVFHMGVRNRNWYFLMVGIHGNIKIFCARRSQNSKSWSINAEGFHTYERPRKLQLKHMGEK